MVHTEQSLRHLRKLILFIGIPLFIVIIIVVVFFTNLTPRQSASKQISPTPNNNQTDIQLNAINPPSSPDLPQSSPTVDIQAETQKYKTKFEIIKTTLSKYDKIFDGLQLSGQCYSSINDAPKPEQYTHAAWVAELKPLLTDIPEASSKLASTSNADQSKLKTVETDYKNYVAKVAEFLDSEQKIYNAWVDTNQVLFKLCDSTIDQIGEVCKPVGTTIDNYKKLLVPENNQKLFTALDQTSKYCNDIQIAVKNDDLAKFDKLNSSFGENYIVIFSSYPNISDKSKAIKEIEIKIIVSTSFNIQESPKNNLNIK
jgi:hypothetical protein